MRQNSSLFAIFLIFQLCLITFSSLFMSVNAAETITLNPIADSYVGSMSPSTNHGADALLEINFHANIWGSRSNAYLLFNLTQLDVELFSISSATLELYSPTGWVPTAEVGVHSCQVTDWDESEITWENAPPFSSEPLDVTDVDSKDTWYSWNITDEVKNSQESYMTLVLVSTAREPTSPDFEPETYTPKFYSKETLSNPPRLVIEYEVIPEFHSYTLVLVALTVVTVAGFIYKKRLNKKQRIH